jgi:hypothetical protein
VGKDKSIRTVALVGFIVSALSAIPVFTTGEDAEDAVKHLAGVSKALIEEHKESATVALWLIEALGLFSLIMIIGERMQWKFASKITLPVLLLALTAAGSISYTGYIGGKIRHTEISAGAAASNSPAGENAPGQGEQSDHDDD